MSREENYDNRILGNSAAAKPRHGKTALMAALFWVVVWEIASLALGQKLLLPSPVSVLVTLVGLLPQGWFWMSVLRSAVKIFGGFLLAVVLAVLLAAWAYKRPVIRALVQPLVTIIKATPVVSFIILALVWINSAYLSVFIPALMVFPQVYMNMLAGLGAADPKLLEMAAVYRVPAGRVVRDIYVPACLPYFKAACSVGLGICWKSGIAAEVIGLPSGTIGYRLYEAKVYLQTPELFAWTLVIILVSVAFEKLFFWALGKVRL